MMTNAIQSCLFILKGCYYLQSTNNRKSRTPYTCLGLVELFFALQNIQCYSFDFTIGMLYTCFGLSSGDLFPLYSGVSAAVGHTPAWG